jgi:hypothetical protein
MARSRRPAPERDPAVVLVRFQSADEDTRIKALHSVCPCGAGYELYEQLRGEIRRLQKDPSPRVRAVALHVEQDACKKEAVEAEVDRAEEQGWRYSDPGWMSNHHRRRATRYRLPL